MKSIRLRRILSVVVVACGVTVHCEAQSVEELVRDGISAYQRSDFRPAIAYLENALRLDPGLSAATVSVLGSAYELVGADDKAIAIYERVTEKAFDRVYINLIQLYLKHARPDDARKIIGLGVRRFSADASNLKRLAVFLVKTEEINSRESDDSVLVETYRRILGLDQSDVNSYVGFARILIKRQTFPVLGSLIRLFHASVPGDPRLDLMLGRAMFQLGKYDSAEAIAVRVLQSDPQSSEGLLLHGQTLLREGLGAEAINHFKRALAVNPSSADAYIGIAAGYAAQRDTIRAIDAWEKALSINPGLDQTDFVALCVAWGTRLLREGNLPSAVAFFSKVDSLQPARPEDDLTISKAHYMNRNIKSARDHAGRALHEFGKRLEDHPTDLPTYVAVCECHILTGELLSAENDIQRYLNRAGPGEGGVAKTRLRAMIESGINAEDVRLLVAKYFPDAEETDEGPEMTFGGSGATDTTRPVIVILNSLRTRGMKVVDESADSMDVSGFTADSSGIMAVYVNGSMAKLEEAARDDLATVGLRGRGVKFNAVARLISGDNEVEVRAVDNAEHMSTMTVLTSTTGSPPTQANTLLTKLPKLWAVVIGISRYQRKEMHLDYADKDALLFYGFLKGSCGGRVSDDHVDLLLNRNASRANIIRAFNDKLRRAAEGDMVVVYLACHGIPDEVGNDVYFMGCDGDPNNIAGTGISQSDIYRSIESAHAKKVVLIADACHSGSLGMGPTNVSRRGSTVDLRYKLMKKIAEAHQGVGYLLASSASEFSEEGRRWGGGHGAFTYHLVTGLFGAADGNHDGIVTVRELLDYVYRHVADDTHGVQHPILQGNFDNNLPMSVVK